MPKSKASLAQASGEGALPVLRYAHPFFRTDLHPVHAAVEQRFGSRLSQSIASTLGPVPPTRGSGVFSLADVIGVAGAKEIEQAGALVFHAGGDSGVPEGDHETKQVLVAGEMAKDFEGPSAAAHPAFLLHLGDVIYGSPANAYLNEFYRPYMHYPGKIIAVPGNHDGESAAKLQDFQANFCALKPELPKVAGSIFRQTMTQLGVYWRLDTPFAQIIGLYSNNAENPGSLSGGEGGAAQVAWLAQTLADIKASRTKSGKRRALFVVTHHPPYSAGGHSGSSAMLAEIDACFSKAGLGYDAFFSGHAHSLQLYVKRDGARELPFVVSGCAGHGGQTVPAAPAQDPSNPAYVLGAKGWGFVTVTVKPKEFTLSFFSLLETPTGTDRRELLTRRFLLT